MNIILPSKETCTNCGLAIEANDGWKWDAVTQKWGIMDDPYACETCGVTPFCNECVAHHKHLKGTVHGNPTNVCSQHPAPSEPATDPLQ